ncbi:unnamed protein product [Rotaria sp. Silwood2]|nr:unnamed protein product [Rotaria sp. Silwood2]CAF4202687.1 unnamed protein product [Rotaria sp. Silwood2]CAF4252697.1 unnamed protein product [Rotaria sp. Silwood2]
MCDNSIPIIFVVNNDLKEWPLDSNVVVDLNEKQLPTFIDEVQVTKFFNNSSDEPFVRFKLTHIVQSGEWVLGISWYHPLGDAASCLHFSNTLSRFYQQMEPTKPLPIFERRLWREDEADESVLPMMKHLRDAKPAEEVLKTFLDHQLNYDQVNLHFSGDQLATLRKLAGGDSVTIQDALTAYIILTLNTYCYNNNDERRILRTNTVINFRGVSDSIASQGQVANAVFSMLSNNFDDPYSLSNIAKTIRQSIIQLRDSKFLEAALATLDGLMRKCIKNNKLPDLQLVPNEFVVNSNFRHDWASLVDFGYTDKCRLYTAWTGASYLRVFRLNPEKDGNKWLPRDRDGAEVAFRVEKDLKEKFINACKRDINENFKNVKQ